LNHTPIFATQQNFLEQHGSETLNAMGNILEREFFMLNSGFDAQAAEIFKQTLTTFEKNILKLQRKPIRKDRDLRVRLIQNRSYNYYTNSQYVKVMTLYQQSVNNNSKITAKEIALKTGVKVSTVYKLLTKFKNHHDMLLKTRMRHQYNDEKFSPEMRTAALDLCEDPTKKMLPITVRAKILNRYFSVNLSYYDYYNLIKHYDYSYRKIRYESVKKFSPELNLERINGSYKVFLSLEKQEDIIAIDETSFSRMVRLLKGWELKGKPSLKIPWKTNIGKTYSLIAAISLKHGLISCQIVEGSFNAVALYLFIRDSINIYRQYFKDVMTFYMDNGGFHSHKRLLLELEHLPANFIFGPRYTPEYNAIEEFFGVLKMKYKPEAMLEADEFLALLRKIFSEFSLRDVRKLFFRSFCHMLSHYLTL
jgi:transposase